LEIDLINGTFRYREPGMFGIKRHITEIHARLPDVSLNLIEYEDRRFGLGSRLDRLLNDYVHHPLCVRRHLRPGHVRVITAQHFLYLLTTLRLRPCAVFCHDLIRLTRTQDYPSRMNLLLTRHSFGNLARADRVVTLSEHVRGSILDAFHLPPERVVVVPCAVDHRFFRPDGGRRSEMRRRWGVGEGPVLLYVGSEEPRKNLDFLVQIAAEVRRRLPDVLLVKVGHPQYPGGGNGS
jgi:glycosyltransferase involved in cell wall biosynthesis